MFEQAITGQKESRGLAALNRQAAPGVKWSAAAAD
jgi:hypothetical protein